MDRFKTLPLATKMGAMPPPPTPKLRVPVAVVVTLSFAVMEATFVLLPVMVLLATLNTAALFVAQLLANVVLVGLRSQRGVTLVVVQEAADVEPQNMVMSPLGTTSPLLSWVAV